MKKWMPERKKISDHVAGQSDSIGYIFCTTSDIQSSQIPLGISPMQTPLKPMCGIFTQAHWARLQRLKIHLSNVLECSLDFQFNARLAPEISHSLPGSPIAICSIKVNWEALEGEEPISVPCKYLTGTSVPSRNGWARMDGFLTNP